WVARILIAVLVVSFAVWGVSDMFGGVSTNSVARVGSADIRTAEYQQRYQQQISNITQQVGRAITVAESQSLNIPQSVLSQMVSEALFDDQANQLGLSLTA